MNNISGEDRERIARLPAWTRDLIKRLEYANEPLINEVVASRQKLTTCEERCKRLYDANSALMELLSMAGKAGLDWAAKTVAVLEGYEIFKPSSAEQPSED